MNSSDSTPVLCQAKQKLSRQRGFAASDETPGSRVGALHCPISARHSLLPCLGDRSPISYTFRPPQDGAVASMATEPTPNVWGVAPAPASKSDWADSVDQDEAANGGQLPELPTAPLGGDSAFPSLGEAAKPATKKKGRVRGQTLALSEFQAGPAKAAPSRPVFRSSSAAASKDRSTDIKASLPKGPRERDENEPGSDALGGGFKDYSGAKARGNTRRASPPFVCSFETGDWDSLGGQSQASRCIFPCYASQAKANSVSTAFQKCNCSPECVCKSSASM